MDQGRTSAARGECTPGVKDHPVGTSAGGFDRGWGWMQTAGIQRAVPDGGILVVGESSSRSRKDDERNGSRNGN